LQTLQERLDVTEVPMPRRQASGRAKCPYDPTSNFVFTYVSKCTASTCQLLLFRWGPFRPVLFVTGVFLPYVNV